MDRHDPLALRMHSLTLKSLLDKASTNYLYEAVDALGNELDIAILQALNSGEHLRHVQRVYLSGNVVTDKVIKSCAPRAN